MNTHRLGRLLIGVATALFSFAAPAFDIYQLPMFATGAATPNVMLLVDTSGSMDNIIWADDFDVTVTYPNWSNGGSYWNPNDGNVFPFNLVTCSNGYVRGKNGSVTKCLKLPDPVGSGNTRYDGNYLNYLFNTYANNTDLTATNSPIPHGAGDTRIKVAKAVAADLVNSVTGVRFGVSHFYAPSSQNYGHGATIDQSCDDNSTTHVLDVQTAISGFQAESNTPLAEALYEITRYFRGLSSYYHSGTTYTSPLQYRCQKNFTIVITDGFPTYDNNIPNNDLADPTHLLPDWDGLPVVKPGTTSSAYPLFPQYSDGFNPGGCQATEGCSLYLDDIAKFGFDIDMKTSGNDSDTPPQPWGSMSDPAPLPGEPDFRKQNMSTYTVGFATANQMLEDAAEYGGGQYFTAKNANDLKDALEHVLLDIQNKATAAASVSLNSTRLDANFLLYQARFDSTDWSGDLQAYPVDDTTGAVLPKAWSANEHIPAVTSRTIVTQKSDSRAGIAATWANLTTGQQDALKLITSPPSSICTTCSCTGTSTGARSCRTQCPKCGGATTTAFGAEVLDYILGVRTKEVQNGGDFRDRSTVLGDIVNSDPLFVGKPDFGYNTLPGTEGTSYATFRASAAYTGRPPMVYVGANDGMLHGIEGSETGTTAGTERFAYIPLTVFPRLKELTKTTYSHLYYVNGSPQAGDAYINSAWKTVLVGTLGKR